MPPSEPVVLVDMSNLFFRCHYAFNNLGVEGRHTGVLYGVLKTLYDLRISVSPRILFCWDHGVPVLGAARPTNWREQVMPSYKANRKPNDSFSQIVPQLAPLYSILSTLGYSHVSVMGLEADDIIGVLSRAFPRDNVLIFSTDRDFYQLLDETHIHVLVPRKDKGQFKKIYQSEVERDYGIPVSRWAEYLALGGDSSDNIKPMRGMGPKTALKLLHMGADLNLPFRKQPKVFQQSKPQLEAVWDNITRSHHAARIPVDWRDPRIADCLKSAGYNPYTWAALSPAPVWVTEAAKEAGRQRFQRFLQDHKMTSLLAIQHGFFDKPEGREHNTWNHPPSA